MRMNRPPEPLRRKKTNAGFTLTEVLVTLVILGIILDFSLRFFTEQWRVTQEIKDRMEAHYAVLNAGRTVLDAIRSAQTVEWDPKGILRILPWNSGTTPDAYYLADKDYDGIQDLYWDHKGVPNPISSRMCSWSCVKGADGLWTVTLQAQVGRQTVKWTGSSHPRTVFLVKP